MQGRGLGTFAFQIGKGFPVCIVGGRGAAEEAPAAEPSPGHTFSAFGYLEHPERLRGLSSPSFLERTQLKADLVRLFKTRRPGSGEISSGEKSDVSDGTCYRRVAVDISSQLRPLIVEVISVDKRINANEAEAHIGLLISCSSICSMWCGILKIRRRTLNTTLCPTSAPLGTHLLY